MLLDHADSPFIRCTGFLYLRYTCPYDKLLEWYVRCQHCWSMFYFDLIWLLWKSSTYVCCTRKKSCNQIQFSNKIFCRFFYFVFVRYWPYFLDPETFQNAATKVRHRGKALAKLGANTHTLTWFPPLNGTRKSKCWPQQCRFLWFKQNQTQNFVYCVL